MVNREELRMLCKRLNLHHLSKIDSFDLEIKDKLDYFKYLLEYEIKEREKKVRKDNITTSHLPKVVPFNPKEGIEKWNYDDLRKLKWLEDNESLIIVGKCGKGKTTMAANLGYAAIEEGFKVYYLKIDELIKILKSPDGQKEKIASNRLKDADIIILDELMYLPIREDDIILLYKAIMYYKEARSFIFITNRRVEEWTISGESKYVLETFTERIMNGSRQIIIK